VLPDGVETDLWATVLVVADGENNMAAYVDLDVVVITRPESDAIRQAVADALGIAPENVRASITHNHAGPPPSTWNWTKQGREALEGYYTLLPEMVAGAARLAQQNMRPARIAVGHGQSHVAVNRRETGPDGRPLTGVNPEGLIDPDLLVVRIDDREGNPLANIVGYTMHPTTMGPTNRMISSDWPGHMKRTVEAITGATCLFAQGATGNVGPGPDGFTDDAGVIRRIGAEVGCEAARVALGLRLPAVQHRHERVWESGAPLGKWTADPLPESEVAVRTVSRTIDLPLREQVPPDEAEAAVKEAEDRLDALKASGAPAQEIEAATFVAKRANMARSRSRAYYGRTSTPVALHLLQIGPVVFAGFEGEPFAEIGLAVKEQSPFEHTWFGGYTGGWAGYIPTADAYPHRGYEVDTSPFAPEAASRVVEGTTEALKDLAGQPS
jgi:hypothetical protein